MDERLVVGKRIVTPGLELQRNAEQLQADAYQLLIGKKSRTECDFGIDTRSATSAQEVTK